MVSKLILPIFRQLAAPTNGAGDQSISRHRQGHWAPTVHFDIGLQGVLATGIRVNERLMLLNRGETNRAPTWQNASVEGATCYGATTIRVARHDRHVLGVQSSVRGTSHPNKTRRCTRLRWPPSRRGWPLDQTQMRCRRYLPFEANAAHLLFRLVSRRCVKDRS